MSDIIDISTIDLSAVDLAIVCDRLGLKGAGRHDSYEQMVATWHHVVNGVEQLGPPSREECIAEWQRYLAELRERAEPHRGADLKALPREQQRAIYEARAHLGDWE